MTWEWRAPPGPPSSASSPGSVCCWSGCTRGATLHIHISRVQLKWSYFKLIIQGGLPSLARQGLASVATICLNHAARPYGDAAIAAMGVVQRITTFGASAMIGFGQGFQPVCGFNYGARLYHRVKEGFWFCVKVSAVFLLVIGRTGVRLSHRSSSPCSGMTRRSSPSAR